ncbi:MAG: glycosyltransferase [Bacillota bacterium]
MTDNPIRDIIMIGYHPWKTFEDQGFRTRPGHLVETMSRTSQVGKVLYVPPADQPGLLRKYPPVLAGPWWEVYAPLPRVWAVDFRPGVPVDLDAPALVTAIARKLDFSDPVLWLSSPLATPYIRRVGERLVVFDAVDNWLEHLQFRGAKEQVAQGYQTIREQADVIFTVSTGLAKILSGCRGQVHWIPNGVDVDFLQAAARTEPPDLLGLRRPLLGYVGVIQERVDTGLLGYLATQMPHATIVLVGPVQEAIRQALARYPNIRFLGLRHYLKVPGYIKRFDVCLLPHFVNSLTESMDPIKLYEYLALGKPVVATRVAGAKRLQELIYLAQTPKEFYVRVLQALQESPGPALRRIRAARSQGWQQRVNLMLSCLERVRRNALSQGIEGQPPLP